MRKEILEDRGVVVMRINSKLKKELEELYKKEYRSLSAQIEKILSDFIGGREQ